MAAPLTLVGVQYDRSPPALLAPAAGDLLGAGGSTAPLQIALQRLDVQYDRTPPALLAPAASLLLGAGGSDIALQIALQRLDVAYDRSPPMLAPSSSLLVGLGGASIALVKSLQRLDVAYDRSPLMFSTSLSFTAIQNPPGSRTVTVTAAAAPAGLTYASTTYDFGDGTVMAGPNATHTYAEYGQYTVLLTATYQQVPGISLSVYQLVDVVDTNPPKETLNELLNREIGYHYYEPIRTAVNIDSTMLATSQGSAVLAAAGEGIVASLLATTPLALKHVRVGGDVDCKWRLQVDGVDVQPSRRTNRHEPDKDILAGAVITVAAGAVITVVALNAGLTPGTMDAFIHAERIAG